MSVPVWTVEVAPQGTTSWVTLQGVQTVTITKGTTKVSDNLRPGIIDITGRLVSSLPTIKIGDEIRATCTYDSILPMVWHFRVSDAKFTYGFTSSMDTWGLSGEDAFAYLGRAKYTGSWGAATSTGLHAKDVVESSGCTFVDMSGGTLSYSVSEAANFTDAQALDIFQQLVNTEQAFVYADGDTIYWTPRGWQATLNGYDASDNGVGISPLNYDGLEFGSIADNYADYVVVGNSTGDIGQSGSGVFGIRVMSLATAAEGDNLAAYIRGVLSVQSQTPNAMSLILNGQTNPGTVPYTLDTQANVINIRFRGSQYLAVVLGYTVSGDTSATRVRYNLSSTAFYSFLVLNDATFGTLGYNKLGL